MHGIEAIHIVHHSTFDVFEWRDRCVQVTRWVLMNIIIMSLLSMPFSQFNWNTLWARLCANTLHNTLNWLFLSASSSSSSVSLFCLFVEGSCASACAFANRKKKRSDWHYLHVRINFSLCRHTIEAPSPHFRFNNFYIVNLTLHHTTIIVDALQPTTLFFSLLFSDSMKYTHTHALSIGLCLCVRRAMTTLFHCRWHANLISSRIHSKYGLNFNVVTSHTHSMLWWNRLTATILNALFNCCFTHLLHIAVCQTRDDDDVDD